MESQRPIPLLMELEAFLMDRAMVPATKQNEIRKHGGAAERPVIDMMALPKAHATPREAATTVAVGERPSQRRRDRARPGADFDHAAVGVVSHDDPAGVARQTLRRSSWNACTVLEDGLACRVGVRQDVRIDVDHDLEALPGAPGSSS